MSLLEDVETYFQESFFQTIALYSSERKEETIKDLVMIASTYKPYLIFAGANLSTLTEEIFGKETLRDFICTFTYNFIARYALDHDVDVLRKSLALATRAINRPVNAREPSAESNLFDLMTSAYDEKEVLTEHMWLIGVLLVMLFINSERFLTN